MRDIYLPPVHTQCRIRSNCSLDFKQVSIHPLPQSIRIRCALNDIAIVSIPVVQLELESVILGGPVGDIQGEVSIVAIAGCGSIVHVLVAYNVESVTRCDGDILIGWGVVDRVLADELEGTVLCVLAVDRDCSFG